MPRFTEDYYKNTQELGSSPLLIEALSFLRTEGKIALDLGCGTGRDTKLLLENNFQVKAVDSEPLVKQYIENLQNLGHLTYTQSTFENFNYQHYDVINARYSLPFNPREGFPFVINKVLKSLNSGGVFVGQLFGINDEWNVPGSNMSFFEKSEVQKFFTSLEIIKFDEKAEEGLLANGSKKHWHVFDIIARQK